MREYYYICLEIFKNGTTMRTDKNFCYCSEKRKKATMKNF